MTNNPLNAIEYQSTVKIYQSSHLGKTTKNTGLDSLTMTVEKGEIFGLLGLNGAGKTTAMKLLTGLLFPTSGTVKVFDQDITQAKNRIGFLPELPYFYSYLTPAESLEFYGRLSQMEPFLLKKRIAEILERVGLSANAGKKSAQFSKGMMQRLGIAQALLHDPDILVLDEPVSGLDPLAVRDIRELLLELNRAGKTIFLSSHSISQVEQLCARVAILVKGRLARMVEQKEWQSAKGGLEDIFVQTVTA